MHCYICEVGEVRAGKATMTLERKGVTYVVNNVPALICQECGENYIDDATKSLLLKISHSPTPAGVHVDIREFETAFAL